MRKTSKQNKKLNRLELLLMGYFKEYWRIPLKDGNGAYSAEEHRYISYDKVLSSQEIQNIIRVKLPEVFPYSFLTLKR